MLYLFNLPIVQSTAIQYFYYSTIDLAHSITKVHAPNAGVPNS
jgi:hypothetical protein